MRISKYLAHCGVCSRRTGESLVAEGRVQINDAVVQHPSVTVTGADKVYVDGQLVHMQVEQVLWLVNKPAGVITTHNDPQERPTIWDFLKSEGFPVDQHWITVGRLDLMSEGLILVTNNGDWAQKVGKSNWPRTYRVCLRGPKVDWGSFCEVGIKIDGAHYAPFTVKEDAKEISAHKNRWIRLTLTEGKNREIRKIMAHFDLQVSRLIRTDFGPYSLVAIGKNSYIKENNIEQV